MANNYTIKGFAHWAKVLGEPVDNFDGDAQEWTIDIQPDAKGLDLFKRLGLADKIKNKDDDREDFVIFKRRAINAEGVANDPIEVVNGANKEPWDDKVAIGNGSAVAVKFGLYEGVYKKKPYTKLVPYKITVNNLVEYVAKPKAAKGKRPVQSTKPSAKGDKADWENDIEEPTED